jgi:hypothetical protein
VNNVQEPSAHLNYDALADLTTIRKPTVFFTVTDLLYMHKVHILLSSSLSLHCTQTLLKYNQQQLGSPLSLHELLVACGNSVPTASELAVVGDADTAQVSLQLMCTCTGDAGTAVSSLSDIDNLFLKCVSALT